MELPKINRERKAHRKPATNDGALIYGKVPPQAKELEEAVLGAILIDVNAFDAVAGIVRAESFYVDAHQRIFKAIVRLTDKMIQPDMLTVVEELKRCEELNVVGGPYAITKLTNNVVSSANIEVHARIIQQKFIQRDLIRICGETITDAYEASADPFDLVDNHETELLALTSTVVKGEIQESEHLAMKAMERIDFLRNHSDQLSGVPTGYPLLDKYTNGWQATDLIILAARPSVGKTAFALNLTLHAAKHKIKPVPVAFFSLEMSAGQLVNRILATESQVPLDKISNGKLDAAEYSTVHAANTRFSKMPIYIDDTAALNVFEFRAKARRLVNKFQVGLIIIDYLQLMSGQGNGNREQEISNISRSLKSLAKQLNIPIIALSQMSRAIETRKDRPEPMLSDLRESGAIEQDADMVMFLYRPDYQQQSDEVDPMIKGDAFCKIAKHRNGDLFKLAYKTDLTIQTWFSISQFEDYSNNIESSKRNTINFDDGIEESEPYLWC